VVQNPEIGSEYIVCQKLGGAKFSAKFEKKVGGNYGYLRKRGSAKSDLLALNVLYTKDDYAAALAALEAEKAAARASKATKEAAPGVKAAAQTVWGNAPGRVTSVKVVEPFDPNATVPEGEEPKKAPTQEPGTYYTVQFSAEQFAQVAALLNPAT